MLKDKLEEIKLLMQYAVPKNRLKEATELVLRYKNDALGLNTFHAFYSFLPEAEDDLILSLRLLDRRQGSFLIHASTMLGNYIYLVNREKAEFLGPGTQEKWDRTLLDFFGYSDNKSLNKRLADPALFDEYKPSCQDENLCPVCHAAHGEHHTFGCPTEICPWCSGQLTNCNCRFNKLKRDQIKTEGQIDLFRKKLDKKGRIRFDSTKHRLSFAAMGEEEKEGAKG